MSRYLVVANQTLGSDELWSQLAARLTRDDDPHVYVLVPNTAAVHYHVVPAAGGFVPMPTLITESVPDTDEEATARAQQLLDELLARVRGRADADGTLGDADPFSAIRDLWDTRTGQFDEVLISTLPERRSRWRQMDLRNRVEGSFHVPVTVISAKG